MLPGLFVPVLPGLFFPVLPGLFVPVLPGLFVPVNSAMHADSESRDILADYSGFKLSPLFFNQKLAFLAGDSGYHGIDSCTEFLAISFLKHHRAWG